MYLKIYHLLCIKVKNTHLLPSYFRIGVHYEGEQALRRAIQRWRRGAKKKLANTGKTGTGKPKNFTETDEIFIALMRRNKKTIGENLKVYRS